MTIRVLANDNTIHEFPDTTHPGVIVNTLARYHRARLMRPIADTERPPATRASPPRGLE